MKNIEAQNPCGKNRGFTHWNHTGSERTNLSTTGSDSIYIYSDTTTLLASKLNRN